MNFSHAANTDGLAEVDVASDGCGSGVEPSRYVSRNGQKRSWRGLLDVGCKDWKTEGSTSQLIVVGVLWKERF